MAMQERKRPGVHRTISNRTQEVTIATTGTSGGGGGSTGAGVLTVSDAGVLCYSGAAPVVIDGVLMYTPTPTMADTVMTIS